MPWLFNDFLSVLCDDRSERTSLVCMRVGSTNRLSSSSTRTEGTASCVTSPPSTPRIAPSSWLEGQWRGLNALFLVLAPYRRVFFVGAVCRFVEENPTFKMLALVGEGLEMQIPKGYLYFVMGFSAFVEILNMKLGRKSRPMKLQGPELEGVE